MAMQLGSGPRAEINVTPMIDVLLVLLIIFMVIGPVKSGGFDAKIPQTSSAVEPPEAVRRDIVIRVGENAQIEVNSQAVTLADLAAKLRPALRPGDVVFVQGARTLEFREIAAVLDEAREAGVGHFAFIPWN